MSARLKTRKEGEVLKAATRARELAQAEQRAREIPAMLAAAIRQRGFGDWSHTGKVVERLAALLRTTSEAFFPAALERLVLHVHSRAPQLLEECPWNTRPQTLPALIRVGAHSHLWLRPPEGWHPLRARPEAQFGQLVHFLFACYPVPAFMDAVFYEGDRFPVEWYFHVGTGQNIRTATGMPVPLTKRMAHEMMLAGSACSFVEALRIGQVRGLGGSSELARQVARTRLGTCLLECSEEEWWLGVLHWMVNNLEGAPVQAGDVFDYVWSRRYGHAANGQRPDREFSMKGRNLNAVLRLMGVWHDFVNYGSHAVPNRVFRPCGLPGGSWLTGDEADPCLWTLDEVRTMHRLRDEGQTMGHCVYSYAGRILRGECSIWSLRAENQPITTHGLTLEVCLRRRAIVQARGRFNRQPTEVERHVLRQWAQENELRTHC